MNHNINSRKCYNYSAWIFILLIFTLLTSCKKDWLDAKPDNNLVVPTTISDMQALLDNNSIFNYGNSSIGENSTDDYFYSTTGFNSIDITLQSEYTWQKDIPVFSGGAFPDWQNPYTQILYTNLALEGIQKILPTIATQSSWNNVYGSALYYRATAFFNLCEAFTMPYDVNNSNSGYGIPLKLTSDVNIKVSRGTIQQTYAEIIKEYKQALNYLQQLPLAGNLQRPSKSAAYGMLARVYLSMNDFKNAYLFSDSCLQIKNTLIDYNSLDTSKSTPVTYPNSEIINDYILSSDGGNPELSCYVDSTLYKSYNANDLRKFVFFKSFDGTGYQFRGNYTSFFIVWQGGVTVDEMFLTRAECNARLGNVQDAMADLNTLLVKRWKTGTFVKYTATNNVDALNQILVERRKELIFRGTRWIDLRRLNQDPQYAITLTRNINGQVFTLPANDPRYAMPIPPNELLYNPIQQNPR